MNFTFQDSRRPVDFFENRFEANSNLLSFHLTQTFGNYGRRLLKDFMEHYEPETGFSESKWILSRIVL